MSGSDNKDYVLLGKILKDVENETKKGQEILKDASRSTNTSKIIGITGPPGAGKSTLVSKLAKVYLEKNLSVAVICIDPSSPFTNGALLGDRIRMQELSKYSNLFIKSLATRGSLGGLANTTSGIVKVFEAYGMDVILVESVGVGQIEFDILDIVDSVILVNVPGLGDSMQTMKAGIVEIADIFVINQADRPGADDSVKDLKMMINESLNENSWKQPILKTIATSGEGISELVDAINEHFNFQYSNGDYTRKRKERNLKYFNYLLEKEIMGKIHSILLEDSVKQRLENIENGVEDPFDLVSSIFQRFSLLNNREA